MRIGITGHQRIEDPKNWNWVEHEISRALLRTHRPVVGVTSLAVGADQLFAQLILGSKGTLEVILPFPDYERTFKDAAALSQYKLLLSAARHVTTLQKAYSDEEAFNLAGKTVVDQTNFLIAVWNGKPAGGLGGTADIVEYAIQRGRNILHLNPVTLTTTEICAWDEQGR